MESFGKPDSEGDMRGAKKAPMRLQIMRDMEAVGKIHELEAKLALLTDAVKETLAPEVRGALETELAKIDDVEPEAKA